MRIHGERGRFWLPIVALAAFVVYSAQKLIRAHIDPEVSAPKYTFEKQLPARRGSIYAAYGHDSPLVKSVPYWEYHLDPVALTNSLVHAHRGKSRTKGEILRTISEALGLDAGKVAKMADNSQNRYQFLALSTDPNAHRTLTDSSFVAGVAIGEKQLRQYLHERSLAHILGSVNAEGVGSSGLELKFNRELSGRPGVVRGLKDARGRELYDKRIISTKPVAGSDIYLTIDPNIQFETEQALKWGLSEFGAASGWCIVMDVGTGAIHAMASYPDFHPLKFGSASESARTNRAIAYNFEPGSVVKVLTVAAAIDSNPKKYGPRTMYPTNRNDPKYYKLPGDGMHVWEPMISLKDAIVHSSNIVIGKLAYDLGSKTLYDYFRRFGFGERTGIDLPGEAYGILKNPYKREWDLASRSRAGIGQFIAVTPIQLLSAYQAIANNGVRLEPYVVDRIVNERGEEVYRHQKKVLSRPISTSTARVLRSMMLEVASPKGTARRAAIRGYSVAGKTGTAQKASGGKYIPGLYRASFCGIVPASAPKIVILATLDFEQKTLYHQGGNSAGPVFKRVALAATRYLGIAPDRPEELEQSDFEDDFDQILDERARKYDIIHN